MTQFIVDVPIKNCDFPWFFVCLPEGKTSTNPNRLLRLYYIKMVIFHIYASVPEGIIFIARPVRPFESARSCTLHVGIHHQHRHSRVGNLNDIILYYIIYIHM